MAILSLDAYAKKCNMPRRALMVYVKRGNIIVDGEFVDSTVDKNIAFYNKREAKGLLQPREKQKKASKAKETQQEDDDLTDEDSENDEYLPTKPGVILSLSSSEKRKKHFDAVAAERTVTLREIEIQKKTGEVIPTESVITLFKEVLRLFAFGYRELYEREVQKIAARADLNAKEIADLRSAGITGINEAYAKALRTCKDSVKAMVSENTQIKVQNDTE